MEYRLEECSKCALLKGEMSCSVVGILQELSEGSSGHLVGPEKIK